MHRGPLIGLGADGREVLALGAVHAPFFPRSSNKPLQAAAMVGCGLKLEGELLALAAASHSGEDFHVAGVREILARAGLSEDDLQCPAAMPLDEAARDAMIRRGAPPDRVHMTCSGTHAAMLATCVAAGWPAAGYRDPAHPLQAAIRETVERLAGARVTAVGVDGCGAPLFALPLSGLARAFRAMVLSDHDSAERAVADAMRRHPDWTSGSHRPERLLMDAVPGMMLKSGAEGVEAFALADGRAGAFKIDDGAARARTPVTVALLRALGAADGPGVDRDALDRAGLAEVMGGDERVGEVRVSLGC